MAERLPLVSVSGRNRQLATGDTLPIVVGSVSALPTASSNAGRVLRKGSYAYISDGTAWLRIDVPVLDDPWRYVHLAADATVSTTAYADVAGMNFNALANTIYEVEVFGAYQSAATTTGLALALNGPASTAVISLGVVATAANTLGGFQQIALNSATGASTGVATAASNTPVLSRFLVSVAGTAGVVQLRLRSEVASSAVTLKAGLFLLKYRVAQNYPAIVASPYFGTKSIGVSAGNTSDGRLFLDKFTLPVAANISGLYQFCTAASGSGTSFKGIIFSDVADAPGTLLVVGTAVSVPASANAWIKSTVSGALSAGDYWIGLVGNSFQAELSFGTATGSTVRLFDSYSYASPPSTPGTLLTSYNTVDLSVYVEYEEA